MQGFWVIKTIIPAERFSSDRLAQFMRSFVKGRGNQTVCRAFILFDAVVGAGSRLQGECWRL